MDKHALALISIVGSSLDVLGALYLAYDLLGGEHGPLRAVTRGVTYGVLFGIGYGLAFGLVFGLACGAAHGITLAWEYSRFSRQKPMPGPGRDLAMSAIRGCGFAIGASYDFGLAFGITFALLGTIGQTVAYRAGIRPTLDYAPARRPGLTRHQFYASVNRTVGNIIAGYLSALVAHRRPEALAIGLKLGLLIGLVTTISIACTPLIEWTADHLPQRRMGVFGVALILIGFALQSVQYWMVLLNVPVS